MVLPTKDEEASVAEYIHRVKNALLELDVTGEIIVTDSSVDRTPEITDQLSLAEVHSALAYYYEHPDEMATVRGRQDAVIEELKDTSKTPEEPVQ